MPSISSASQIRKRTLLLLQKIPEEYFIQRSQEMIKNLIEHLQYEYLIIPERERVGKGAIYICKYVAKELVSFLSKTLDLTADNYLELSREIYQFDIKNASLSSKYLSLLILAEFLLISPHSLPQVKSLIELAAADHEWSVRETAIYPIISCLRKEPEITFQYLNYLTSKNNENLRRLVSESLRPSNSVKWLRNADKNDKVLLILSKIKADNSIYVRKSVGNNLKDLSKYMPEKILDLMENWIHLAKIKVTEDLASEKGLSKENRKLIWTIKHAMRWIQKRELQYHDRLERILGKNYVIYFDEKSNKFANPHQFYER